MVRPGFGTVALVPQLHGTGSGIAVPVPRARYQGFSTRFSGDYVHFSRFGSSLVRFRHHFSSRSGGTSSFGIKT